MKRHESDSQRVHESSLQMIERLKVWPFTGTTFGDCPSQQLLPPSQTNESNAFNADSVDEPMSESTFVPAELPSMTVSLNEYLQQRLNSKAAKSSNVLDPDSATNSGAVSGSSPVLQHQTAACPDNVNSGFGLLEVRIEPSQILEHHATSAVSSSESMPTSLLSPPTDLNRTADSNQDKRVTI